MQHIHLKTTLKRFQWKESTLPGLVFYLSVYWSNKSQVFVWDVNCVYLGHDLGSAIEYQKYGPGAGHATQCEQIASIALSEHPAWSDRMDQLYMEQKPGTCDTLLAELESKK